MLCHAHIIHYRLSFYLSSVFPPLQSVFIITYRPPDNPEYKDFQRKLHAKVHRDFGIHLEPTLVGCK